MLVAGLVAATAASAGSNGRPTVADSTCQHDPARHVEEELPCAGRRSLADEPSPSRRRGADPQLRALGGAAKRGRRGAGVARGAPGRRRRTGEVSHTSSKKATICSSSFCAASVSQALALRHSHIVQLPATVGALRSRNAIASSTSISGQAKVCYSREEKLCDCVARMST